MNLPLSVYDILGYLASGFLILAAAEFGFDGNWLVDREWKPGSIALFVTMAYIIGHILANLASELLEHRFGRGVLGPCEELLFGIEPQGKRSIWKIVFPGFHKALPHETQDRILKASAKEGFDKPGRGLFLHAFAMVKQDKPTLERMNTFLNIYGFCRNIAFALLIAVAVIAVSGLWYAVNGITTPDWKKVGMAVLCLLGSWGMIYRYLKFYRHYTQEVLITYPELKKEKSEPKS